VRPVTDGVTYLALSKARYALRASLPLAFVLVLGGCVSEDRIANPLGGRWSHDRVRVTGWEPSHTTYQLRYGDLVVDTDIDDVYFFAPDCLIYSTNRANGASYAIWGDRLPVQLPFSIAHADERAVWGGNRINDAGQEEWKMLLVSDVLAIAASQPPRPKDWRWKLNAAPLGLEPQWVSR
jgi:hypothetical protein